MIGYPEAEVIFSSKKQNKTTKQKQIPRVKLFLWHNDILKRKAELILPRETWPQLEHRTMRLFYRWGCNRRRVYGCTQCLVISEARSDLKNWLSPEFSLGDNCIPYQITRYYPVDYFSGECLRQNSYTPSF